MNELCLPAVVFNRRSVRTFSNLGEVREGKKFWPNNFILFSKSIISNPPLGYVICFVGPGDVILQNGHFSGQNQLLKKSANKKFLDFNAIRATSRD